MKMREKTRLKLKHVEFDRGRFRRYYGNIGEMVVAEVLVREGFKVWFPVPYHPEEPPPAVYQPAESKITFFGDKLGAFELYRKEIHGIYMLDLVAKKNDEIYIVEVKTNEAVRYLRGEKLEGLMLARKYGFIPMLATLKVSIEVTDLMVTELSPEDHTGFGRTIFYKESSVYGK